MILALATILAVLPIPSPAQTTLVRDGASFQIQLPTGGVWGPGSRTADHAVVAMNSAKDILVAYHTDRNDLDAVLRPKQVEAALFDYAVVGGVETWTYVTTFLLGSTLHNPLGVPNITHVKCERPDVVAVGDQFFVVWTRRYQGLPFPLDKDPAVLECAWIDVTSSPIVYDSGGASPTGTGLGFILDDAFNVLECAGVPDAAVLDDGTGAGLPEVDVVYPAQTGFSSGSILDRSFDLRIATCTLDVANPTAPIASIPAATLTGSSPVAFNGNDNMSAGLILPDLARGINQDQFILAYEEQFIATGPPSGEYGLIRMHRIVRSSGTWSSVQSHSFGNAQDLLARRRPNLASHPVPGSTVNNVTIAFNIFDAANSNADADVVFSEWIFDPDDGIFKVQWTSGLGQPPPGWPNDPFAPNVLAYDFRPIPLHGKNVTFRRRYAETFQAPAPPAGNCDLVEYDLATNQIGPPLATAPLGRPAVAYLHDPSNAEPDYATLTWEQRIQTNPTSGGSTCSCAEHPHAWPFRPPPLDGGASSAGEALTTLRPGLRFSRLAQLFRAAAASSSAAAAPW